ncbi:MAG: outer membrane lipoprotein carrier protein LolA [Fimbriimonadaceae bacterium]
MSLRLIRATSLLLVSATLLPAAAFTHDEEAQKFLELALAGQRNFHAVIVQNRMGPDERTDMLVKIQIVPSKGMKSTVLQPLSMQGFVVIDDGEESKVYDPDREEVLIQPSPNKFLPSTSIRSRQIKSNYAVEYGRHRVLAGRSCHEVVLSPKEAKMPQRRLSIDNSKRLILRYVIVPASGEAIVFTDVKSVIFDQGEANEDFGLPAAAQEKRVRRMEGPQVVSDPMSVKGEVGFSLKRPKSLPFGFDVHAIHLVGHDKEKSLAIRTSDGMSFVTVYVRKGEGRNRPSSGSRASVERNGIRFSAVTMAGDPIPREVLTGPAESVSRSML